MCTFMLELCVYRLVWMSSEPVWLRLWFVDFFNPAWVYEIRPGSRDRDPSVQRGRPRQQFLPGDTRKTACRPGPPFTVRGGVRGRASPPLGDPTPQVIWGVWPPPATFPGPPPTRPAANVSSGAAVAHTHRTLLRGGTRSNGKMSGHLAHDWDVAGGPTGLPKLPAPWALQERGRCRPPSGRLSRPRPRPPGLLCTRRRPGVEGRWLTSSQPSRSDSASYLPELPRLLGFRLPARKRVAITPVPFSQGCCDAEPEMAV